MAKRDPIDWRGLPHSLDAERFVLGSILLDDGRYLDAAYVLLDEDFALEKHRRIFRRMADLHDRGDRVDRVTVANELLRHNELESVDGLAYLVSLDDGLPHLADVGAYIQLVKKKSILRKVCCAADDLRTQAILETGEPNELLSRAERMLVDLGLEASSSNTFATPGDVIRKAGSLQGYLDRRKESGITTGFSGLDRMTGGMRETQLWILAAYTAGGKSTFMRGMALDAAREGFPGAIITLEMDEQETTDGLICAHGGIDTQIIRRGLDYERDKIRRAASEVADLPIYIRDRAGANVEQLHGELRKLKAERDIRYAMIDYLQLLKGEGKSRYDQVSNITRGLKLLAMDLRIPVVALSQLSRPANRQEAPPRPTLAMLRDSGSIEQDANVVIFLYSEQQTMNLQVYPTEVIVAKQRGGPEGVLQVGFEKRTGVFREMDEVR